MSNAKIISLWGSPGSGKTFLCSAIGDALTKGNKRVAVINMDILTYALQIWVPQEKFTQDNSLSTLVFGNAQMSETEILKRLIIHPRNSNLGFMGFCNGDNFLSFMRIGIEKTYDLLNQLSTFLDYIILDCPNNPQNTFTAFALENSNVIFRCVNPDVKSATFCDMVLPMLTDKKYKLFEHVILLNGVKPFSPVDEAQQRMGIANIQIPWSTEAEKKYLGGQMLNHLSDKPGKMFEIAIGRAAERVKKHVL